VYSLNFIFSVSAYGRQFKVWSEVSIIWIAYYHSLFVSFSVQICVDVEGLRTGHVSGSKYEHITAGKANEDNEETILEEGSLLPMLIIMIVLNYIVNYNSSDHEDRQNVDDKHLHHDSCFSILVLSSQFFKGGSEGP